ncbi:MAG: CooT family nickel-binding protein [Proteobacteria bacterium]|nr:CooT family nickel-binding protein [Pseudomonadota bacterium]
MCEANAYIIKDDKEEILLESVDVINPLDDNHWYIKNIFGEQIKIKGRIKYISLLNHKVVFENF